MKELTDKNFKDWFSENIGYGYGTGEQYTVPALKGFLDCCPMDGNYDYSEIEKKIGHESTWFLMSILGKCNFIEYGTSPRYGWLDDKGKMAKKFLEGKSNDDIYELVTKINEDEYSCGPTYCNCGEGGYKEGKKCDNPLFN